MPVDLHPDGVGSSLVGREEPSFPDTQNGIQSDLFFEEGDVDIGWKVLVYLHDQVIQLITSVIDRLTTYFTPDSQQILPELWSLHEAVTAIGFFCDFGDRLRI